MASDNRMTNVKYTIQLEVEIRRLTRRLERHWEINDELKVIIGKRNLELRVIKKKWETDKEKLSFYTEPFKLRPTYQELEKKLEKIKELVNHPTLSDFKVLDKIDTILEENDI